MNYELKNNLGKIVECYGDPFEEVEFLKFEKLPKDSFILKIKYL